MINQSKGRNLLSGFEFESVMGGFIAFVMLILNTFTVTVEVFLRRDMGQRYFNFINWYAGFLVFSFFAIIINAFSSIGSFVSPNQTAGGSSLIFLIWIAYCIMSVFHFLRQWWREESGRPVHSLHPGTPRLLPLGRIIMRMVNKLLEMPVRMFSKSLALDEREEMAKVLPVLKDPITFTLRIVEPFFLFVLSTIMTALISGLVGTWLFLSSMALLLYINIGLEKERHTMFNVRDQMLEATEMQEALNDESEFMRIPHSTKIAIKNAANKAEESPTLMDNVKMFNPSIAEAMAAINPKLQNLSKNQHEPNI